MNPIELTFSLDIDQYLVRFNGYDQDGEEVVEPQTLEDVLLERAAAMLSTRVAKDVTKELSTRLRQITDEAIRTQVVPIVEKTLATPFRRSNAYGEPSGPETTMRDEIVRVATEYLTKPADNYHSERGTAVQAFIKAEVEKAMKAELKAALDEAKTQVRTAVTEQAASLITQTLAATTGVKL